MGTKMIRIALALLTFVITIQWSRPAWADVTINGTVGELGVVYNGFNSYFVRFKFTNVNTTAGCPAQGWKDGAGSLMGKKNAILKREQGGAKLTIMIQPTAAGSMVRIFTEGLDWSGGEDAAPSASKKATDGTATDDIEAQARKAIQDALKNTRAYGKSIVQEFRIKLFHIFTK